MSYRIDRETFTMILKGITPHCSYGYYKSEWDLYIQDPVAYKSLYRYEMLDELREIEAAEDKIKMNLIKQAMEL